MVAVRPDISVDFEPLGKVTSFEEEVLFFLLVIFSTSSILLTYALVVDVSPFSFATAAFAVCTVVIFSTLPPASFASASPIWAEASDDDLSEPIKLLIKKNAAAIAKTRDTAIIIGFKLLFDEV